MSALLDSVLSYVPTGGGGGGKHNNSPGVLFAVAAAFIVIGGLNAFRPELAFKLNAKNYKNESAWEPSRQGLIIARVSGSIGLIIGIVCLVIAFTKL